MTLMINQGEDMGGVSEQMSQLCPCSDLSASSWACFLEREMKASHGRKNGQLQLTGKGLCSQDSSLLQDGPVLLWSVHC